MCHRSCVNSYRIKLVDVISQVKFVVDRLSKIGQGIAYGAIHHQRTRHQDLLPLILGTQRQQLMNTCIDVSF